MIIKGRWKGAFIMIVLWSVAVSVTMFLIQNGADDPMLWISLLSSSIILGMGLVVYLGEYKLLAGVNTMSEQERSQYNMDEIASFMGMILVIESFVLFATLAVLWEILFFIAGILVFFAILIIAIVYININKKFKTDPQAKKLNFVQR
jgi:hypothetical protein